MNNRIILLFLFLTSFIALFSAYISQHVFGLQPCVLCIYQRVPFFLVMAITLLALLLKQDERKQKIFINISLFLLFLNAILAIYHVGVERGVFIFEQCADFAGNIKNIDDLKDYLSQAKAVRCDEPQFYLFGITMAGWNVLYCLGIVFSVIFIRKKFK